MPSDFERQYYEQDAIWDPARYAGLQEQRAKLITGWLPEDTQSVLDVGCGNGVVTNSLRVGGLVVGVDRSLAALQYVKTSRCLADIQYLPFGDNSFDVVIATEVFEHLAEPVVERGLHEVARVARHYVILAVPYRENIPAGQVQCPRCACRFHPSYHMRGYGLADLERMFMSTGNLFATKIEPIMPGRKRVGSSWLARLKRWRHDRLPQFALCPQCGYSEQVVSGASHPSARSLKGLLRTVWPTQSSFLWWMALYEKRDAASHEP
jgi:SAM-dependent methyltransferase